MGSLFKKTLSTLAERKCIKKLSEISLTGRDFLEPGNLTGDEIKSVLWTAMDLKYCKKQNCDVNLTALKDSRISLLLDKPCTITKLALCNAAKILNTNLNVITNDTWNEVFGPNRQDYGQLLSCYSDIIFCKNALQSNIQQIADGAHIPVIGVQTSDFNIMKVLCDLMTLQLRYNHLRGLTVAWVGVHDPLLNTYLCILPRLGINLRYFCGSGSSKCVPSTLLSTSLKYSLENNSEIHECSSVDQAVYRADVVSTANHCMKALTITKCHMETAALSWSLLGTVPRGFEVDKEIFKHKNSLVWQSLRNAEWIYTALIIRFLKCYNHVIKQPTFDDMEASAKN